MIIGERTIIGKGFQIDAPQNLKICKDSLINYNCSFYAHNWGKSGKTIVIGDNTQIGYGTTIIATTHEFGNHNKRAGNRISKTITIGNGCWVGANVTILPGVRIDDGVVIAAGSVVIEDCESDYLYAGIPAKKKNKLQR